MPLHSADQRLLILVVADGLADGKAMQTAAHLGCHTLLIAENLDPFADTDPNAHIRRPARRILIGESDSLGELCGGAADISLLRMRIAHRVGLPGHQIAYPLIMPCVTLNIVSAHPSA